MLTKKTTLSSYNVACANKANEWAREPDPRAGEHASYKLTIASYDCCENLVFEPILLFT